MDGYRALLLRGALDVPGFVMIETDYSMKQTNLQTVTMLAEEPCPGKLAVVWGLYGAGIYLLWEMAGHGGPGELLTWGVALAVGTALALGLWEGRT